LDPSGCLPASVGGGNLAGEPPASSHSGAHGVAPAEAQRPGDGGANFGWRRRRKVAGGLGRERSARGRRFGSGAGCRSGGGGYGVWRHSRAATTVLRPCLGRVHACALTRSMQGWPSTRLGQLALRACMRRTRQRHATACGQAGPRPVRGVTPRRGAGDPGSGGVLAGVRVHRGAPERSYTGGGGAQHVATRLGAAPHYGHGSANATRNNTSAIDQTTIAKASKASSEYHTMEALCGGPRYTGTVGCRATTYSTYSGTKSGSSSEKQLVKQG
jgi:hypothetical protein